MLEWFQMGGYAAYVWPAYGLTIAGLLWVLLSALRAHARAMRDLTLQSVDGKA